MTDHHLLARSEVASPCGRGGRGSGRRARRLAAAGLLALALPLPATMLWSDLGATLAHDTGDGTDILGGVVKRDNSATDTLYFKFHVDPLSDASTEEYFAAFELFEGSTRRLAVGNATKAWAYSAFHTAEKGEFNKSAGDYDLHSARPESTGVGVFKSYEQPRRGIERTIVFKVQYVPDDFDEVTVWLNPELGVGAAETNQLENSVTRFKADCSFDEIHLRHGGGGDGWTFSDMAIATSFNDFIAGSQFELAKAPVSGRSAVSLSFRSWQREQGLPHSYIHAMMQSRNGYLWLGTEAGLVRFDGVRFVSFGEHEGFSGGEISQLLEDKTGRLWLGSTNHGLNQWHAGQLVALSTGTGLPSNCITALAEDHEGTLWIGTPGGLVLHRDGRLMPPPGGAQLQGKPINALFKDRSGAIWVAAKPDGVFRFQSGKYELVTSASDESLLQDVHCLLVDQRSRLWVGAGDDYVLCRDGQRWSRYRIPRHLERPFINSLAETPDGAVWAGSISEGLFRFLDGKAKAINAGNGLLDNFVETMFVDREGILWVGVSAGLSQLRTQSGGPSNRMSNESGGERPVRAEASAAPAVILEEVLVDGEPVVRDTIGGPSPANLRIPPGRHRFEFRYTGLSFQAPERIRFRCRVNGLDTDWLDMANRRSATYGYMPPGEYVFEVKASNADGLESATPATLGFAVLPFFWQTRWFMAFVAVGLLVSVGGTIRFVEQRKMQKQLAQLERERALARERARIAQDLHDDLGASLSRISLLSDLARAERNGNAAAERPVDQISQLAGQTLRALDEIVWAVRPGSDSVQSLVEYIAHFANELSKGNGVRCRLDLPDHLPVRPLPPELRHNIFLIAKEALNNAYKHANAREISVQVLLRPNGLDLRVQDDGQGFDPARLSGESDGNGLENMRQRAAAIGAKWELTSERQKGTTIRLSVEFARAEKAVAAPA